MSKHEDKRNCTTEWLRYESYLDGYGWFAYTLHQLLKNAFAEGYMRALDNERNKE